MTPWKFAVVVVVRIDYGMEGERRKKHCCVQESVGIAAGFLLAADSTVPEITKKDLPEVMDVK